jgi:hypothetical protein
MSPARRSLLVSATVLVAAAATLGTLSPGIGQAASASSPILFGAAAADQQQVQYDESVLGGHMQAIRDYKPWDGVLFGSQPTWMRDTGHTLFMSVSARRRDGSKIPFASIAAARPGSQLYADMQHIAAQIKAFGAPVYITFNHEPETTANQSLGNGAAFAAAWRNFVTVMRASGVTNAKYVVIFTAYTFRRTDSLGANAYYPGDAYVDGIGADAYNWYTCKGQPWTPMSTLVSGLKAFGAAHPTKQVMITEFGSVEDPAAPGRKAQWITDTENLLKSPGYSQFTAIMQWTGLNNPSKCSFNYTTSSTATAAWVAMGRDPAFQAG